jgi:hypothetical protein
VSYDLMVFEPGVPPDDRHAFIAWFASVIRLREGHLRTDPLHASPALRGWHEGMSREFPQVGTPRASLEVQENERTVDYRFAPAAIFARFEWRVSRKAYHLGMRHARANNLGFFDLSGDSASVYTVVNGRFVVAHRGEAMAGLGRRA